MLNALSWIGKLPLKSSSTEAQFSRAHSRILLSEPRQIIQGLTIFYLLRRYVPQAWLEDASPDLAPPLQGCEHKRDQSSLVGCFRPGRNCLPLQLCLRPAARLPAAFHLFPQHEASASGGGHSWESLPVHPCCRFAICRACNLQKGTSFGSCLM